MTWQEQCDLLTEKWTEAIEYLQKLQAPETIIVQGENYELAWRKYRGHFCICIDTGEGGEWVSILEAKIKYRIKAVDKLEELLIAARNSINEIESFVDKAVIKIDAILKKCE